MENKRRRVAKEDRISNLPEHLIDSILELLPIKDVVSTSILSKKWRYRWTTMRTLVFDEQFSTKFAKNGAFGRSGIIRIINQVVILHNGPILKFHLHIPDILLDSFQEVDQWMQLLSKNGVRELILTDINQRYGLSSHVFSCLELTKMALEKCLFKPPLEFVGFLNLEEVSLKYIDFGANMSGAEIKLPQLKNLHLNNCTNVYNFNIKAKKLRNLTVIACPDAMLHRLLDSKRLFVVAIYFLKPIEYFVPEKMDLAKMLSNLSSIKSFGIDGHFLKFLAAEKILNLLPHAVNRLKTLRLFCFQLADLDQLCGALFLLQSSPNLQKLQMYLKEPRVDMGPASIQLESPNCLDCTLNKLQIVEIENLKGSRLELLFIKLLLSHSPSLEKLTIRPNGASDVQKRFGIAKDVMQFPRASTNAKIFYLDPKTIIH